MPYVGAFVHLTNLRMARLHSIPVFSIIPAFSVGLLACVLWMASLLAFHHTASAQPLAFGSADDPREELLRFWWRPETTVDLMGGFSLIGAQWRTASHATVDLATRAFTARLEGTLRAGFYGTYDPDLDEAYDLVRLLAFARYNPPRLRDQMHIRLGPLQRVRLGAGQVVNFFNSTMAWDERTVGVEAMWRGPLLEIAGFSDNILVDGVTGGRIALTPLFRAQNRILRTLQFGFNAVSDLSTYNDEEVDDLTAFNADLRFQAIESGGFTLSPFASYAKYTHYGGGIFFGADFASENFIDIARLRFRVALHYNGREYLPEYFSSFYPVNNTQARILQEANQDGPDGPQLEGLALTEAPGGNDIVTELRILFFRRFEFWYYFRRHYSTQRLSEYHLRLFLRTNRFHLNLGQDRGSLLRFLTLFNDLGDRSAMVFDLDYRVVGPFWINLHARYTYERLANSAEGEPRFLVQRRFEPFTGFRLVF